ncbi:phosphoribosylanthranilate isomerase [Candidatus Portiera aleyrodidarum]|uniref:N-(5'-phosphoribosyl)anthranilate isomerase n=1 Tax=Candidatus Portiera aleyrodidarum MED (Bemisia tabaci) TaxID=1163752 RepID=A0AAU8RP55_9GAMM|nr:phosphoribosylanthranilate isomerase [Candidatus Portiera aleyrodidarum]AFQ24013.1 phosphoribosylanthranilate isomerase [Candidatus Portiera aleyrodidarum BT-B-HRs]AFS18779.1 N-(5'-phosphoribosyl)anthranilate isomerase [Candidatus Portiera aleyrodidarum BT-QVLC]AFT80402.1 Phosphoribosylanthranilate isomerase [Candidatus Portiera aleyrodidarum BT-QVLC]AFT80683.1 Phosphoribosylanthranilate isomerase [Candidatus Portiera aleyrodidarum BT-B-HRs]AJF23992.1 N-(5'-phosphoribosyl)anthranilate isome
MKTKRVKVKYCGITNKEDLKDAVNSGVDALGFILWPGSKRSVDIHRLILLSTKVPVFVCRVGVFFNQSYDFISSCTPFLDSLQFHGNEHSKFCNLFKKPWIKALRMSHNIDLLMESEIYSKAYGLLLDTYCACLPGGTGKSFDWFKIKQNLNNNIILAGGLNSLNVNKAIKIVLPYAVDVAKGIELSEGIKDHYKMNAFAIAVNKANILFF